MFCKISSSYKVLIRFKPIHIYTVLFLVFFNTAAAQDTLLNKYGLWVINEARTFKKTTINNPEKQMVDIRKMLPSVILDLKYAGRHNFMNTPLYPHIKTTYLRGAAAEALGKVQQELYSKNLGIKIWDAYRPYTVTERMWEPVKDSRYAADPKFGSGHNRGIAIDITLVNLRNKTELNMGTGFDNFSDTAHTDFINLPEAVMNNRKVLISTMEKYGFKVLETEWWHFYLPDTNKYELLNLSFKALKKLQ